MTATWTVYLSGEIHSDWRERIHAGVKAAGLPAIFGAEADKFWHDRKGAQLNAIRTQNLLKSADIVVVRFGEKYKQWNAAFDAGYAAAMGIPYITLHPTEHDHALKEVDGAANAVAREPEQVVAALAYVINGVMPQARADAAE
jgi:YtoQ family protein